MTGTPAATNAYATIQVRVSGGLYEAVSWEAPSDPLALRTGEIEAVVVAFPTAVNTLPKLFIRVRFTGQCCLRYFTAANLRRYLSATSNSLGSGASIITGSLPTGCLTVRRLAWSARRLINGFSSTRPL